MAAKRLIAALALLLMPLFILGTSPAFAQYGPIGNVERVSQFAGTDVATKLTAAQAACDPNLQIPCVIVFDPILAVYPLGTLPDKCAQCVWLDYSGVTGTQAPAPSPTLSFSPQAISFPATNTGQCSVPTNVTFTNTSTSGASILFSGISFAAGAGSVFSQTSTCGTLLPQNFCTVSVKFCPTAVGAVTDTLQVSDNGTDPSGSQVQMVALSGSGQTPTVPTASSGTLLPASPSLAAGTSANESATLVMSDSTTRAPAAPYWHSATTAAATVNEAGNVTGVAAGSSVITANLGDVVQVNQCNLGAGPFTTLSCPLSSPVKLGNRLLIAVGWGQATGSVSGVTDGLGNTITAIASTLEQANGNSAQLWTATGSPAGSDSVTVTYAGGGVGFPTVTVAEIEGSTAVDVVGVGTVASGTTVSASLTTTQASDSIFAFVVTGNAVKTVGSGYFCVTGGTAGQAGVSGATCLQSGDGSSLFGQGMFASGATTASATTNAAANSVITAVALKTVSASTTATVTASATVFSLSSQPPAGAFDGGVSPAYVTSGAGGNGLQSLYNQPLPGNCYDSGVSICPTASGILTHPYGGSFAIADNISKYTVTGNGGCVSGTSEANCDFLGLIMPCGTCGASNSASSDSGCPPYYSTQADPWYNLNVNGGLSVAFHAPQFGSTGPVFSNGSQGDQFVCIYDQAQNIAVQIYKCCTSIGFALPASTCPGSGTLGCAQNAGSFAWAQAGRPGVDSDWYNAQTYKVIVNTPADGLHNYTLGEGNGGTSGIAAMPWAAMIRFKELAAAAINHAYQISVWCTKYGTNGAGGQGGWVFPAVGGTLPCGTGKAASTAQNSSQPLNGMLLACDYTSSQITGFGLDPVDAALLRACSRYGLYVTQTGAPLFVGFQIAPGGVESQESFKVAGVTNADMATVCANNPNFVTCTGTTTKDEAYAHLAAQVPLALGPEGSDQEGRSCTTGSGCAFSGHVKLIDPSVPRGMVP